MSNKQTALDFLLTELDIAKLISRENLTMAAEVVRQAKEMEKQQKEISYADGYSQGYERVVRLIEEATKLNILRDNNGEITTMGGDNNIPDTNPNEGNTNTTGNLSGNIWGGDTTSTTENISATWGGDTSNNKLYDSNTWMFRRKMVDENVNRIKTAKQIWDKETMAEYVNKIEAEKQIWDKTVNWDIMNKHTRANDEEQTPYNVKTNVVTSGKTNDGTLATIEITIDIKQR